MEDSEVVTFDQELTSLVLHYKQLRDLNSWIEDDKLDLSEDSKELIIGNLNHEISYIERLINRVTAANKLNFEDDSGWDEVEVLEE
jgi:hypothetical protein